MPFMRPFAPVWIDGVRIVVDKSRPVAAILAENKTQFITWPNAALPPLGTETHLIEAPDAVWVIYTESSIFSIGEFGRASAVRLGADGSIGSINLDNWRPVGADEIGLWCVPGFRDDVVTSIEIDEFEDEVFDISPGAPLEEPEDLPTSPPTPISLRWENKDDDDSEGDGEFDIVQFPAGETPPTVLHRMRPSGAIDTVTVDRHVTHVESAQGSVVITYQPTAPRIVSSGRGGASYHYPRSSFSIPLAEDLPATIFVGDFQSTPIVEERWDWKPEPPLSEEIASLDISDVVDARWSLRPQDPAVVGHYVAAIRAHLLVLGEPDITWLRADNQVHRVRSDYRGLEVEVAGEWPDTEAIAEFRYHPRDDVRFRFRLPLFDGAGRPNVHEYFTVHLMEDLDTTDFAESDADADGTIELGPQTQ